MSSTANKAPHPPPTEMDVRIGKVNVAKSALATLLLFSLAMIVLPIASYYTAKSVCEDRVGIGMPKSSYWGAGAAVVMVHIIMGTYAYLGWKESVADDLKGEESKKAN